MMKSVIMTGAAAFLVLGACSQADAAGELAGNAADSATAAANDVIQLAQAGGEAGGDMAAGGMGAGGMAAGGMGAGGAMGAPAADMATDLSLLSAGTYKSDDTHEYVAFDYMHQGYSNPILTWDAIDATINLNPSNLEASTLEVSIPATSVNSGVPIWDERMMGEGYFDAENHPNITFNSTALSMSSKTTGTVTGNLTIKGMTKPVTLDVKLNKVGKHFRNGNDWFGISATGAVNRSDFGISNGIPATSDNVNIRIEIEFGHQQ